MFIQISREQLEEVAEYIRERVPDSYNKLFDSKLSSHVLFRQVLTYNIICSCYDIIGIDYSSTDKDEDFTIIDQITRHIKADPWLTFGKPSMTN
jgi:hypothetical protein